MKKIYRIVLGVIFIIIGFIKLQAQDNITLRFTGQDQSGQYLQLSRVVVENISQNWQEVLFYPDTTLFTENTGIGEINCNGKNIRLLQNIPNPFDGVTDFVLQLPEAMDVRLEIYDLNGKMVTAYKGSLGQGSHQFRAWLSTPQTYLLNAYTSEGNVQIKMLNTGNAGQSFIKYLGEENSLQVENSKDGTKGGTTFPFTFGDMMSYEGYAHLADRDFTSNAIVQAQYSSELIKLTFTLPLPTVTTEAASNITNTEAQLNGSVLELPEYPVIERGFLFADNDSLTGAVAYPVGSGNGVFSYTVSNLQVANRYHYQAYARTAVGTSYGNILYFDTHAELPVVLTLEVTDVKASIATCGGNVTATGGADVTARGVCWNTTPNPTINDSFTSDSTGLGAFTSHMTGLSPNTSYYVRAYATNSAGTAYGEQRSFTTWPPFYCGHDTVTDYDGNSYHTVEIGQQCWMKENLRTTHYADGSDILDSTNTIWQDTTAYFCAPCDNSDNVPIYGYLYNWTAMMNGSSSSNANPSGVQGICPPGWHVPSKAELTQLINFVSSQSQYCCDGNNNYIARAMASTDNWTGLEGINHCYIDFDPMKNNATGFSATPTGYADRYNEPHNIDCYVRFYLNSTTLISYNNATGAYFMCIDGYEPFVRINSSGLKYGKSVRCLLDDSGVSDSIAILPTISTKIVSDITSSTVSCGGHVDGSGGTYVTARGVCWGTSPYPTVNDSHTSDGNGTGGYTSSITGLTPGTTYYVRAYATNNVGTRYGEQLSFTTTYPATGDSVVLIDGQTCPGADTLMDYDGNIYKTVQIGQQCWMKENLRTTHYTDGNTIPAGTMTSDSIAYRYKPGNQDSNVPLMGYLYNWAAVMHGAASSEANPSGVQGICPTGWHVPSDAEWTQLSNYVESQSQYVCGGDGANIAKALASCIKWSYYPNFNPCAPCTNPISNNATGFTAIPAGIYTGSYIAGVSSFWTSTQSNYNYSHSHYRKVAYNLATVMGENGHLPKGQGFSVRCLRD